jgi:WD40 repeat protein
MPAVSPPNFGPRIASMPDGVRVVSAIGTVVTVTDVAPASALPLGMSGEPRVSPDLRYTLSTSGWVDTLRLADTATGEEKAVASNRPDLPPARRPVPRRFTVDGTRLILLEPDTNSLVLRDVPSLTEVYRVGMPPEMAQARNDHPKRFNTFCVLDLPNPREVAIVHGGQLLRVDVGSGAVTERIPLWRTPEELERLADTVACASRPGRAEVVFDVGQNIELWDLDSDRRTATLGKTGVGTISSMMFSPDGRQLAVTGFDGSLEVWDVETRELVHRNRTVIDSHLGVGLKAFPSADRVVLTSGGLLRVWDLDSNATIADIETNNPFTATVAPDGGSLVYWGDAGLSRMSLDPRRWADHLCRLVGRDLTDAERRDLPPGSPTGPVC